MYKNDVEMRIQVNGRAVREYQKDGLTFIEARNGTNYTIKIKNNGANRVMAVVSVDGLDVITGKPAEKANTGYVIDGYSATEIKGYRVTDDSSAAFVFVSKDSSYTVAATGSSQNAGVIGVRVFKEKVEKKPIQKVDWDHPTYIFPSKPINPVYPPVIPQWPNPPQPTWCGGTTYSSSTSGGNLVRSLDMSSGNVGCGSVSSKGGLVGSTLSSNASSQQAYCCSVNNLSAPGVSTKETDLSVSSTAFDTGTTWGQSQTDRVKHVEFKRSSKLAEMVVYYATKEALISMGVDLSDTPTIAATKDILPAAFGQSKYCQPPKGWNGQK